MKTLVLFIFCFFFPIYLYCQSSDNVTKPKLNLKSGYNINFSRILNINSNGVTVVLINDDTSFYGLSDIKNIDAINFFYNQTIEAERKANEEKALKEKQKLDLEQKAKQAKALEEKLKIETEQKEKDAKILAEKQKFEAEQKAKEAKAIEDKQKFEAEQKEIEAKVLISKQKKEAEQKENEAKALAEKQKIEAVKKQLDVQQKAKEAKLVEEMRKNEAEQKEKEAKALREKQMIEEEQKISEARAIEEKRKTEEEQKIKLEQKNKSKILRNTFLQQFHSCNYNFIELGFSKFSSSYFNNLNQDVISKTSLILNNDPNSSYTGYSIKYEFLGSKLMFRDFSFFVDGSYLNYEFNTSQNTSFKNEFYFFQSGINYYFIKQNYLLLSSGLGIGLINRYSILSFSNNDRTFNTIIDQQKNIFVPVNLVVKLFPFGIRKPYYLSIGVGENFNFSNIKGDILNYHFGLGIKI